MKNRIQQLMKSKEMTQQEFSRVTGISPASLSSIFNGRTAPTMKHAEALHRTFPHLNMPWLLFGEGDMYSFPAVPNEEIPFPDEEASGASDAPADGASATPFSSALGAPMAPSATPIASASGAPMAASATPILSVSGTPMAAPAASSSGAFAHPSQGASAGAQSSGFKAQGSAAGVQGAHPSGPGYAPRADEFVPYSVQSSAGQSSHLNDPSRGFVPRGDESQAYDAQFASPAQYAAQGTSGAAAAYAPSSGALSGGHATPYQSPQNYGSVSDMVNYADRKRRKIVEIRIFFDDGTFETFKGND